MPSVARPLSMRSLVGGLGLTIALLIGLVVPLGYAANQYGVEAQMLSFKAHLTAGRVAKYTYGREEHWQYHAVRLADLIQLPRVPLIRCGSASVITGTIWSLTLANECRGHFFVDKHPSSSMA